MRSSSIKGLRSSSWSVKELLSALPFECVQMVVEMNAQYGHQKQNMNISLAAVGLLVCWSDRRRSSLGQRASYL